MGEGRRGGGGATRRGGGATPSPAPPPAGRRRLRPGGGSGPDTRRSARGGGARTSAGGVFDPSAWNGSVVEVTDAGPYLASRAELAVQSRALRGGDAQCPFFRRWSHVCGDGVCGGGSSPSLTLGIPLATHAWEQQARSLAPHPVVSWGCWAALIGRAGRSVRGGATPRMPCVSRAWLSSAGSAARSLLTRMPGRESLGFRHSCGRVAGSGADVSARIRC